MKERQRIDKIVESVHQQIQEEVGGLIGADLELTLVPGEVLSKEEFFNQPLGKQVFAKMDITGEVEGKGGLLLSVKDAIRLGGTLIMLPQAELDDVVASEEYDGETEDSYGEIANIIAGCYTKVFEEMYPKACRFIRKEQEVLVPIKIDIPSDEPLPDDQYYQIRASMQMGGTGMGELIMLIPAIPFELAEKSKDEETVEDLADNGSESSEITDPALNESTGDADLPSQTGDDQEITEVADATETQDTQREQEVVVTKTFEERVAEYEQQQKVIDGLLDVCRGKVEEEVGALLGVEVSCSSLENKTVDKESYFFDEASGKQVVANMDVVGDVEDSSYLFVHLKDAIRIGCTLIMLPPSELEISVTEEDFNEDSQDAYGEIANIIAGVYTAVFEEQYKKSLRFIKKDIDQIVPMKVDTEADEPIPNQQYYLSSMQLAMDGNEYGKLQMLFPTGLFELDPIEQVEEVDDTTQSKSASDTQAESAGGTADTLGEKTNEGVSVGTDEQGHEDILIVSDYDNDADLIKQTIVAQGMMVKQLSFRDNVSNYLPGQYKAVFIVSRQFDEQSFGLAIKISTACSLPLIAAGTDWTRSKVIKAVKYGVTDILLTPAEESDILEKISNSISKLAA